LAGNNDAAMVREGFLSRFFLSRLQGFGLRGGFRGGLRGLTVAAVLGLLVPVCLADGNNPITLDTSETLFAVLTAINTCGYSVGLNVSDPQRAINRSEGGEEPQELPGCTDRHDGDAAAMRSYYAIRTPSSQAEE
jgi:hypothetical protein